MIEPRAEGGVLLDVRDLAVEYLPTRRGTARGPRVIDGLSFALHDGEALGLAGESGGGKSTALHAVMRTLPPPAVIRRGQVLLEGRDLMALDERALRAVRWREIALVFQSAMHALNPVLRIYDQIADTLHAHGERSTKVMRARAEALMALVELDVRCLRSYPHELSGGMRQRAVIAIALALSPRVLLLDEPTTALDVIVERAILERLFTLRRELGFAIVMVSHDLPLLIELCDTVGVLQGGRLVDLAPARTLALAPSHAYSERLVRSFPALGGGRSAGRGG